MWCSIKLSSLVYHEVESESVPIIRRVMLPRFFLPFLFAEFRKKGVAFYNGFYFSKVKPVGVLQGEGVDLGASNHEGFLLIILTRDFQGLIYIIHHDATRRFQILLPGDNN